ncbi:MAG: hypothetical protein ACYDA2_04465 [Acidimicrobiales bacterium]
MLADAATGRWTVVGVPVHAVPTGAGYSVLLLLHVAAALVGYGALAVTGYQAARARRGPGQLGSDAVRRYFRPGVNWAGRALYAVPVLGFALVADSNGAFTSGQEFVVAGLVLWLAAAAAAEGVVWPAERRIQLVVTERWDDPAVAATLLRDCQRVVVGSVALSVLFVAAVVIMFGKP